MQVRVLVATRVQLLVLLARAVLPVLAIAIAVSFVTRHDDSREVSGATTYEATPRHDSCRAALMQDCVGWCAGSRACEEKCGQGVDACDAYGFDWPTRLHSLDTKSEYPKHPASASRNRKFDPSTGAEFL